MSQTFVQTLCELVVFNIYVVSVTIQCTQTKWVVGTPERYALPVVWRVFVLAPLSPLPYSRRPGEPAITPWVHLNRRTFPALAGSLSRRPFFGFEPIEEVLGFCRSGLDDFLNYEYIFMFPQNCNPVIPPP